MGKKFIQSLENLPNSIEILYITSNFNTINKFPTSLKILHINFAQIDKINLLDDYSINEFSLDNYGPVHNNNYTLCYENYYLTNIHLLKFPKSLNLLKFNQLLLSNESKSQLNDFATQNNFNIIDIKLYSVTMAKNTNI